MSSSSTKDCQREDFSFGAAGLYVHVPFCARRCRYCDFTVTTASGDAAFGRFVDAIDAESARCAPGVSGRAFETLYFGGGTPSRLPAAAFARLASVLRRRFAWNAPEITIEANPDDVDGPRLDAWRSAGVVRVSLGAQSFRDDTLAYAGRSHDAAQTVRAVHALRAAGFRNVNLDLILAMPGETTADVRESVVQLLALEPEHVSLYELVVEPRTVFGKWYGTNSVGARSPRPVGGGETPPLQKLPDESEQIEMLTTARTMLKNSGYRHYELLNYAKPGRESRHNLLYWANRDVLGLGPGATSYVGGRRSRLAAAVDEYYRKVENGDWTPLEDETLTPDRRAVESFLLALRLDTGAAQERFAGIIEGRSAVLGRLAGMGLVERDARGVRLTERGKLFAETVFSELA